MHHTPEHSSKALHGLSVMFAHQLHTTYKRKVFAQMDRWMFKPACGLLWLTTTCWIDGSLCLGGLLPAQSLWKKEVSRKIPTHLLWPNSQWRLLPRHAPVSQPPQGLWWTFGSKLLCFSEEIVIERMAVIESNGFWAEFGNIIFCIIAIKNETYFTLGACLCVGSSLRKHLLTGVVSHGPYR